MRKDAEKRVTMKQSKTAIMKSQIIEKMQLIAGIFITIFCGIPAIVSTTDGHTKIDIIIAIYILTAIGIVLIVFSRKRHNLIKNFRLYVSQLSVNQTGSIEKLAAGLGASQDVVRANLKIMLNRKYFANAFIDVAENRIIFPTSTTVDTSLDINSLPGQYNDSVEFAVVNCKSCGGANRVQVGRTSQCEYCGSYIK